jgi:hypothetical protein
MPRLIGNEKDRLPPVENVGNSATQLKDRAVSTAKKSANAIGNAADAIGNAAVSTTASAANTFMGIRLPTATCTWDIPDFDFDGDEELRPHQRAAADPNRYQFPKTQAFDEKWVPECDAEGFESVLEKNSKMAYFASPDRFKQGCDHIVLTHWHATVLPATVMHPLTMFSLFVYLAVAITDVVLLTHCKDPFMHYCQQTTTHKQAGDSKSSFWSDVPEKGMHALGALLTFFSVFYCTSCYNRYFAQHDLACACKKHILDAAMVCSTYLSPDGDWRASADVVRYMNAAHLVAHNYLSPQKMPLSKNSFMFPFNRIHRLLTKREMWRIFNVGDIDPQLAWQAPILWAMKVAKDAKEDGLLPAAYSVQEEAMLKSIIGLRDSLQGLFAMVSQPVPFMYYNLIAWLNWFYLPFFAYQMGISVKQVSLLGHAHDMDSYLISQQLRLFSIVFIGLVVVFMLTVALLGLRCMAEHLADPWGDEVVDLPAFSCEY